MIDIIVLAVIGLLTIIGLCNGMAKQFFGLAGIVAGYILAMKFYQYSSRYFTSFSPGTAKVVGFIAIFLACILVAQIIGWIVGKFITITGLGFLNRIGGAFLGFLKGYLIVAVVVTVLMIFLPAGSSLFKKSRTLKYFLPVTAILKGISHEDIKTIYDEKIGRKNLKQPKQKLEITPVL